ncbi:MAG: hypothetical protein PHE17_05945 [Thiothrix sp.]|uniref:hypothetical protein n=1 Tax=Thiothrix sp. TaxID=1032 RepID=UPI00261AC5DD|nr:hypothetical protein [Thiothrix sp.]MDD5392542.1 hypothetical protein [Thiothrix sp.]
MQIELNNQRKIRLTRLHQYYTYGGLLLGQPNAETNQRNIEQSCEYAPKLLNCDKIHLIEPVSTWTTSNFLGNIHFIEDPLQHAKECHSDTPQQGRRGTVLERLPLITCFGTFFSQPLLNDTEESNGSQLTLAWYQDELAMPLDNHVIEQIKALDWEQLAEPFWH